VRDRRGEGHMGQSLGKTWSNGKEQKRETSNWKGGGGAGFLVPGKGGKGMHNGGGGCPLGKQGKGERETTPPPR